jgi:hypothetical protein
MYAKGVGIQQDYTQAMRWYEMAAEQGDADADYGIGRLFEEGFGVVQNDKTAAGWYRKAAEHGVAPAEFNLSLMMLKGKGGVTRDEAAAFALCKKAADKGFGPAEAQLATMYEHGQGVTANTEQALFWSTLAAKQQEKMAERQRAALAAKMTPEAVTRTQQLASDWKPVLTAAK